MKKLFFLLGCGIALQLTAQNNFDQAEIRQQISEEETKEILFTQIGRASCRERV